jgi:hypothetical protein
MSQPAIDVLRNELKAIQGWSTGEMRTDTEKIAVLFRIMRAEEIKQIIAELASMS